MEKSISLENLLSTLQIYVCTFCLTLFWSNTLDNMEFQAIVKSVLKKRESQMLEKRNLTINIDSRMVDIIRSLQMVAGKHTQLIAELVLKGRSHHLLKRSCSEIKERKRIESRRKRNKHCSQ